MSYSNKKRKKLRDYLRRKGVKPETRKLTEGIILREILIDKKIWLCRLRRKLGKKGFGRTVGAICYRVKDLESRGFIRYLNKEVGPGKKKYFIKVIVGGN